MWKYCLGHYQKQIEGYSSFKPIAFPPPNLLDEMPQNIAFLHSAAMKSLGELNGVTQILPNLDFFIFMYIRKDAASSSQIEGTKADLVDSIEYDAGFDEDIPEDVDDIIHYIKALNYGMERIKEFPLSLRFIREIHEKLMDGARVTQHSYPGEFRRSQNWIGGSNLKNARYIPPAVHDMHIALNDFENFMTEQGEYLPLLKVSLLHAQFETIHPFADGNGRTGRLLVSLYLWATNEVSRPVLFLSHYFRQNQSEYYHLLNEYHESGDIWSWVKFFLSGVQSIAEEAKETSIEITKIYQEDMQKILTLGKTSAESCLKVLQNLYKLPIISSKQAQEWTGYTRAGAQNVIDRLVELDILSEEDESKKWGKRYVYKRYLNVFK
jgi:Fic family protein